MGELRKVGNFELLNRIGSGGMGSVYRARQVSMDRVVALKILPPELAKRQTFIERFLREARASAKLNHPNIVNGIDVGQADGVYYFAMEYVEGNSIKGILDKIMRVNEERTILISAAIARALAHAHSHRIIHRDIKPDNILIDKNGAAKLCDLGLAALQDERDNKNLTQHGHVVGTPHYISPEQARGEADLDARADLYSLGATMYHMLTGHTLFKGETSVVVMSKHLTEKITHPADLGVGVSRGMLMVLAKLLAKDRDDRYDSAQSLLSDLERLAKGKVPKQAELSASKWPFKGMHQGTNILKKSGHMPMATTRAREAVQTHAQQPAIKIAVIIAVAVIGGAIAINAFAGGKKRQNSNKADAARNGGKNGGTPAAVPPVLAKVNSKPPLPPQTKSTPPTTSAGFKKQESIRPTAPAQTAGFRKITPADPQRASSGSPSSSSQSPSSSQSSSQSSSSPAAQQQAVDPRRPPVWQMPQLVRPAAKAVPETKYKPGDTVAAALVKAADMAKEARFNEASEALRKLLREDQALDEFDRTAVSTRADGYEALHKMKGQICDSLRKQPLDSALILGKNAIANFTGGDDTKIVEQLKGSGAGTGTGQRLWKSFTHDQIFELAIRTLQPVPPEVAAGLAVLCLDRGDIEQMLKALELSGKAGPAKPFIEQLEAYEAGMRAKKERESNAEAFRQLNLIQDLMQELKFQEVHTRATALIENFAQTECVKEWGAKLKSIAATAKYCTADDVHVRSGNVALARNGTEVNGPKRARQLVDGNTSYDEDSDFATSDIPCEWTIRFPEKYVLNELKLHLCDSDSRNWYHYRIEASVDGANFTVVADHTTGTSRRGWQAIYIGPRIVRELRISGVAAYNDGPLKVGEFEAYCVTGQQWLAQHFAQPNNASGAQAQPPKQAAPVQAAENPRPAKAEPENKSLAAIDSALMLEDHWKQRTFMELIEIKRPLQGEWAWEDENTLRSETTGRSLLEIPYQLPEEYDVRLVFTRPAGTEAVVLCLTQDGRPFQLRIGEGGNKQAGFEMVDGKGCGENVSTNVAEKGWIKPGERHAVVVCVRRSGVSAYLDNVLLCKLNTDYKNVTPHPEWKLSDDSLIGVGHAGGDIQILNFNWVEVTGKGKRFQRNK